MASETQKSSNIKFILHLPEGIQLSQGHSLPSGTPISKVAANSLSSQLENPQNSSAALSDRCVDLTEQLKTVPFTTVESFIKIPLMQSPSEQALPALTGGATCTEDTIADVSYLIRTVMPESASAQSMGVTTGENVFQGMWAAHRASLRFDRARDIGDKGGMFEGLIDSVRGMFQSIGGAFYLAYRGTMIAADIHNLNTSYTATTVVGKASYVLGTIGNIFFLLFYFFIGVWSAFGCVNDWEFSSKLQNHLHDDKAVLDFLSRKVKADPRRTLEKLANVDGQKQKSYKAALKNIALDQMAEQFIYFQKRAMESGSLSGKKPLLKIEAKEALEELFKQNEQQLQMSGAYAHYLSSLGLEKKDVDFSTLELIGFKLQEMNRQSKKEAKFSRAVSGGSVDAVKKAARGGLKERLESSDLQVRASAQAEISELKGRVIGENTKNKVIHTALLIIGVLGIIGSILGFMTLNPVGLFVLTVLTLALCVGMLATDAYFMSQNWMNGPPGRYDKMFVVAISLILIAALAVSCGVTFGLGLAVMPLIYALVIGGLGLGVCAVSFVMLDRKEKKWTEEHPDLNRFSSEIPINAGTLDKKTMALFKKLPQAKRRAVREKYLEMSNRCEMRFKDRNCQVLDKEFDFGRAYLNSRITSEMISNAAEHELFVRSVKKTAKFCWKRWGLAKTEENKQAALKMQALLERASQGNVESFKQELNSIDVNSEAYRQLKQNLWYVIKRQESAEDLKKVVDSVIADDARKASSVLSQLDLNPMVDQVTNLFNQYMQSNAAA